jgi:dienelactone hydrolase
MKIGLFLTLTLMLMVTADLKAAPPAVLPGTQTWDLHGDLADQMMNGLHRFIQRKIDAAPAGRERFWKRDTSSPQAYARSLQPNREQLLKILGMVDPRLPARIERYGDDRRPALVAAATHYKVWQVRWSVLDGVDGEGLLLEPNAKPVARVVALPDADQTPEQLVGLEPGIAEPLQWARRLVEMGCQVIVPVLVDRSDEWSGHPDVGWTNQTHREWIHRQAYHMGRHLIGYEVQKVLAAVDWFTRDARPGPIGVAGYGEGGLLAFYAAAVDPRIDACLVSGYFDSRQMTWTEPLYRNVWSLLREFGDAEIASLVAPRGLLVEYSRAPEIAGPPKVRPGRRPGAAVGELRTPDYESVVAEFKRIEQLVPAGFQQRHLASAAGGKPLEPGSRGVIERFVEMLGVKREAEERIAQPVPLAVKPSPELTRRRQRLQVKQLEDHVQRLVRASDRVRDEYLLLKAAPDYDVRRARWTHDRRIEIRPWQPLAAALAPYKRQFWEEVLGRFDDPPLPARPRTRRIYDEPRWTGYEVALDVFPDVFAWGVLLVPKDLKPGERRPVVVCQHGRNGLPTDTIEPGHTAYGQFAARLAEKGFVVYSPHNPYRGEDRYRILSRKANGVKASLFSFILAQHEQMLRWLASRPEVDPKRIAFYGLSYGGETAVRVPPLLDGYCLSICSGDFNDWARKVASTDSRFSFMFSIEWEMPYFNMGSTFNYAEMAYLMIPRPFMVERGHADGVAPDEWVAYEYAKVQRLYDMAGLGDRTAIEFFPGGHSINGQATFEFLEKHLHGPRPAGQ